MTPLLTSKQIHEADAWTIANEPIASIDLMERASQEFTGCFVGHFPDQQKSIVVYCGTGNNGGDGLAIARILKDYQYQSVTVKIARFLEKSTDQFNINLKRLRSIDINITELAKDEIFLAERSDIIIDALLGSGLNKPLDGDYERLVKVLNDSHKTVVAVDVPTGFFCEGEMPKHATVLKADLAITFQQPRINFLLPESGPFVNCFEAVDIGINEEFVKSLDSPYQLIEEKDIRQRLKKRHHFSNKGTFGHALIVAGQLETMGAALLSSSACAHAGAGLTTACIPESGLTALNSYLPEIMAILRKGGEMPEIEWATFSTLAVGPGLGKDEDALKLFKAILTNYRKPIVIDADALNMLAKHPELWPLVPANSIITPHMKEFDRLFGEHQNWWQRLQTMLIKTKEHDINILLKNDYTIVGTPQGKLYFNTTSNAAMASGGMGDILTGVITALLAQKYSPEEACILGAYIHGKAGDELALPNLMAVVLPGKVINQLPATMAKLMA